jgi:hypothetical protein
VRPAWLRLWFFEFIAVIGSAMPAMMDIIQGWRCLVVAVSLHTLLGFFGGARCLVGVSGEFGEALVPVHTKGPEVSWGHGGPCSFA